VTSQTIRPASIDANLSPDAFHVWAHHYYLAKQDLHTVTDFSPVPHFLLCRAIELELKSRLLVSNTQKTLKGKFLHRIRQTYDALPPTQQILDGDELALLTDVSEKYASKGIEYFEPQDALTAFKSFPDLARLDSIAAKLLQAHPEKCLLGYCRRTAAR
jgi:hypothetical protein